jgi:hypothetical protein
VKHGHYARIQDVKRLKMMLAATLAMLGVLGVALALRQAGEAELRATTGANPASAFHEPVRAPIELLSVMRWRPDPERNGRPMEPRTRQFITETYANAWSALDRAGRGDPEAPIKEYFSASALDAATKAIADGKRVTNAISQLGQELELTFYSDDGSVVAFDAPIADIVRVVGIGQEAVVVPTIERLKVVMLLEDGNWRVQQLYQVDSRPNFAQTPPDPALREPKLQQLRDNPLNGANAVTIYNGNPRWDDYDPAVANEDLQRILDLNLNSVRIFIAGGTLPTDALDHIVDFLDRAEAQGIRVVPTLLDGVADHSPTLWANDYPNIRTVVSRLAGHPAIAMWDLKNEPDRDDERSGGQLVVDAWLSRIGALVHELDPTTPVTIGWANASSAGRVLGQVDVVSFHHLGAADGLSTELEEVRELVGDRPIVVSEFGFAEFRGFLRGLAPMTQAQEIAEAIRASDAAGVSWLVWQLRDPLEPPAKGGNAWAQRAELSYGLLDNEGRTRPQADVVINRASTVPAIPVVERVRHYLPYASPFIVLLVLIALGKVYGLLRRRRGKKTEITDIETAEHARRDPSAAPGVSEER